MINVEKIRYDGKASIALENLNQLKETYTQTPLVHRAPYNLFHRLISNELSPGARVLELGSGIGVHTRNILETGASVIAVDISFNSLHLNRLLHEQFDNLDLIACDMHALPFSNSSFDAVVAAGIMSYADNSILLSEINRVLNSTGKFICIDSLDHNPIYRINRFIRFLLFQRSFSTLVNMPTIKLIEDYKLTFNKFEVSFFGSIIWFSAILKIFFGISTTKILIEKFDSLINVKKSAFKFVISARK